AVRMNRNCICNRDGRFLRKLIQAEGERYPELFAEWREQGPGRTWSALAARFARLAYAGYLSIEDPDVAARQFLALVNAELQITFMLGGAPTESEVLQSASNGVRTFLRAFGRQKATAHAAKKSVLVGA
ncbi:MAG: TetR/AcrR family transcriptional regulator, partial [Mesorhizobium sp.]